MKNGCPFGALAYLLRRLLRADEQTSSSCGGEGAEGLEDECALAQAGFAGDQGDRAGDETAAEHAVELADAGRSARPRGGRHLSDGANFSPWGVGGRRGGALLDGPPRPARRAAAHPARRLGSAGEAAAAAV